MKIYAPWEKAFKKIATPFEHFLHAQTTTGMVLMFMTVIALILVFLNIKTSLNKDLGYNCSIIVSQWIVIYHYSYNIL